MKTFKFIATGCQYYRRDIEIEAEDEDEARELAEEELRDDPLGNSDANDYEEELSLDEDKDA